MQIRLQARRAHRPNKRQSWSERRKRLTPQSTELNLLYDIRYSSPSKDPEKQQVFFIISSKSIQVQRSYVQLKGSDTKDDGRRDGS